ncbi:hypothetical protein EG340_04245 [Chryseobacterium indoltheticum]|uniref:Uncharacterized protein n=1 Tax=Chryseobacterium indoltheticum TaxID=254 RepID=A0A3G6N5J2_9FLAO|nr:hypothetical protein EG340_04245 [Chryseobacterium indoltheticum]
MFEWRAKTSLSNKLYFPPEFRNFRKLFKILAAVSSLELLFLLFQDKRKIRKEKFKDEVVKLTTINQQQSTKK